ncbi:MAG: DUF3108 domain-containing protein [Acidobacteriota bacterium]
MAVVRPSTGLVVAGYLGLAVVITWPLATSLTSHLGALQGPGDPFLNLWILGWGLHAWITDPWSVASGAVFDANIFFPAQSTLTYSDHFLLQALALAPVYALTGDVVLCYNLVLIASLALNGLAMHGLAKSVTGSTVGAWVAGLGWAVWPFRTAHLLHLQLQAMYFMPLALWCLHRVVARSRWRDTGALGTAAALQVMASVYYGVMTAVVLVVSGVGLAVATGQWRSRRLWLRVTAAALLAVALSVPVILPYARSQQAEGFGRTLYEAGQHSAAWRSYAQVPDVNWLYGRTGVLTPGPPRPGDRDTRGVEHQLFPGLTMMALALVGAVASLRRGRHPVAASGLVLIAVGVVLSGGPEGARSLYAALHDNVYGFQAIRAPARFAAIVMLGVSLLAALGARTAMSRLRISPWATRRSVALVAGVLVAAVVVEGLNAPLPLATAPARQTDLGQWLAREPSRGAVVHLPLTFDTENTPHMVRSLEHRRPIVNGYSGQRPAFFAGLVEALADFPAPPAWAVLRELDVRFVVLPTPLAGAGQSPSPLVERARFADGVIYELRWTAEALAAAVNDTARVRPPPAGPVPFGAGEMAAYDVFWEGGPLNVAAGRATLRVLDGPAAPARWSFEVVAETADWVSPFFTARDRLTTTADDRLLPLRHVRELREGRRRVNRTYTFDREALRVTVEGPAPREDGPEMTLPLGADEARDAITALYYVRTLPLEPGTALTVPMHEAGSIMELALAVGEREVISHRGQPASVLRLEPRIMRRLERRRPLTMTLWLSTDERRVPVRVLVEAGFGRVRLELIEYQHQNPR